MPHVDLKLRRGREARTQDALQALVEVLCEELNSLREALSLPLLTSTEVTAKVRALVRTRQAVTGAET